MQLNTIADERDEDYVSLESAYKDALDVTAMEGISLYAAGIIIMCAASSVYKHRKRRRIIEFHDEQRKVLRKEIGKMSPG